MCSLSELLSYIRLFPKVQTFYLKDQQKINFSLGFYSETRMYELTMRSSGSASP